MNIEDIEIPLNKTDVMSEKGDRWKNPKETWGFLRQGNHKSKPVDVAKKFIRGESGISRIKKCLRRER